jgi:quinol monooxygenase YgiN
VQDNCVFLNCQRLFEEGVGRSAFGDRSPSEANKTQGGENIMSDMDRRAFVGAAAVGGVAAAVLAASSAMAAGQSGYFVIAEIVSKKDKADELRELLVPFAELSAKEPGCLVYTLMEVIGEPGRFLTFERWTDKAALGVHMTTPHIKEIVPKLDPVLAKPFTQLFLDARTGG